MQHYTSLGLEKMVEPGRFLTKEWSLAGLSLNDMYLTGKRKKISQCARIPKLKPSDAWTRLNVLPAAFFDNSIFIQ